MTNNESGGSDGENGERVVDIVAIEIWSGNIAGVRRPGPTDQSTVATDAELTAAAELDSYRDALPIDDAQDGEVVGQIVVDADGETRLLEP